MGVRRTVDLDNDPSWTILNPVATQRDDFSVVTLLTTAVTYPAKRSALKCAHRYVYTQ